MAGYKDQTIKKMGRWAPESEIFNEYIRAQMFTFSEGISDAMAAVPLFTNMEGCVTNENRRWETIH